MNTNLILDFVVAAFAAGGVYAAYLQNVGINFTILDLKSAPVTVIADERLSSPSDVVAEFGLSK